MINYKDNAKNNLLKNLEKIHTTRMGIERIRKNLNIENGNIVLFCKNIIVNDQSICYEKGKNFYCELDNVKITINLSSFTIITAHIKK
jgi:hypothetical protein